MEAVTELGRNPVSKHQYGAMLKAWKNKWRMILPFTITVSVQRQEKKKNGDKNNGSNKMYRLVPVLKQRIPYLVT